VTYIAAYRRHFFEKTTQIVSDISLSILLKWANLRLLLNVQKPKVFELQGASPHDPLTKGSAPGPRCWLSPQTPYYRGLTLVFGGAPTI